MIDQDWSASGRSWKGVTVPHTMAPWWHMVGAGLSPLSWATSHPQGTEERVPWSPPHEEPKVPGILLISFHAHVALLQCIMGT